MADKTSKKSPKVAKKAAAKPKLHSGDNPQIAKAYSDAPVQAYIAAMPGWKSDVGHRLDAIIERTVPDVYKAVKWNSPFYGFEGEGWFLGIKVHPHDMSHYHTTLGEKLDASQRRDLAQSELLAGLLDKLKATQEADGTRLFDHVALAYGSNIRTGHELSNCPTILTGGAGIKLGHHLVVSKDTPLCNA